MVWYECSLHERVNLLQPVCKVATSISIACEWERIDTFVCFVTIVAVVDALSQHYTDKENGASLGERKQIHHLEQVVVLKHKWAYVWQFTFTIAMTI